VYFKDVGDFQEEPYTLYVIHDSERYIAKDDGVSHAHITVYTNRGAQVDFLTGHSVEEFTNQRDARLYAARMNGIHRVMES
jgi:hypothetical protein